VSVVLLFGNERTPETAGASFVRRVSSYSLDLLGVLSHLTLLNEDAQVLHTGDVEFAVLCLNEELILQQSLQDLADMD